MVTVLFTTTFALLGFLRDPAPGIWRTKTRVRTLDCERLSTETGSQRYPGRIVPTEGRADDHGSDVVACRERLTRPNLRDSGDEAVLSTLEASATDLTLAAGSLHPELADTTWLVEAYYPTAPVAAKIAFATKNALVRRGLRVSDRVPTLAVADVAVLARMGPDTAYPAACRRYFASGSLAEGETLLAIVSRDPRETVLHAGLCTGGVWTWLR